MSQKLPPIALRALRHGAYPKQCHLLCPHLLRVDAGVWGPFLLGVVFRHVICGVYLFIFLPVRLPSEIQKLPPDLPVRGFPGVWKRPLIKTPFPGQVSVLSSFVSLFIFYILYYLLSKTVGCFSGRLMSSASNQRLFCAVCSVLNCSFDEFVGEKLVSTSYSSTIMAPPPPAPLFKEILFSPLYILASFVKDKVSIGVWIYLWAFYFVPLIYISVFVPVP